LCYYNQVIGKIRKHQLIDRTREFASKVGRLAFGAPVGYVYNPLVYARVPHEVYLGRYASGRKRILFLGMNPGPWGMAQTGVPFGEVTIVREWLGIEGTVRQPSGTHPRVAVLGFACPRSEVSGSRLWGLLRERYTTPGAMAAECLVANYCPLMFLDSDGRNLTPDRIGRDDQARLFSVCDAYLDAVIDSTRPELLVGVGLFAAARLRAAVERGHTDARVIAIPHPSPANPQANRDWAGQAAAVLRREGAWS
jgi:single-strand selective monofunctional uracil DNA glycosylase